MSDPPAVVVKEKNPKRVAAGKKLAEKNKMYKEHFEKTREVVSATDKKPVSAVTEKPSNTNYYYLGVAVLVVAGIAYYYQSRPKSAPEVSRPTPQPEITRSALTPPKPDRTISM